MLQDITPGTKRIPSEVEDAVIPIVWAGEVPGRSKRPELVKIDLKPDSSPVRIKQYPLKLEANRVSTNNSEIFKI